MAYLVFAEGVARAPNYVEWVAHLPDGPNDLYARHEWHLAVGVFSTSSTFRDKDAPRAGSLVQETNVELGRAGFTLEAVLDHLQCHLAVLGSRDLVSEARQHARHKHPRESVRWVSRARDSHKGARSAQTMTHLSSSTTKAERGGSSSRLD